MLELFPVRLACCTRASIAALTLTATMVSAAFAQTRADDAAAGGITPRAMSERFTGDLAEIRKRGVLRALVSYSRTDFFIEGVRPRGIIPELMQQLQKQLNKGLKRKQLHTQIHYVIVPFKELIPALREGKGDIAAGFLTLTPERSELVNFATGRKGGVNEILVTHKAVEGINSLEDLSGRVVHVLNGSSYAEHLGRLNEQLLANGAAPVDIRETDPLLATEDLLEMVNAGAMEITVSDDFRAALWEKVLPDIQVRSDIRVNEGGTTGWAVRKNNPQLLKALRSLGDTVRRGTAIGNTLARRYFGHTRWITNPVAKSEREKMRQLTALFRKYAQKYDFDWLALIAQSYQESRLDHSAKSPVGAVGIMQLLPSTASDPNVGIEDIEELENNVHAGAKYMAFLRDRYFSDPELDEIDRFAFTWAAYNAGPGRVRQMRRRATKLGLDRNKWFGNVELAALAIVGQETVRYVSNIYKYHAIYSQLTELEALKDEVVKATRNTD